MFATEQEYRKSAKAVGRKEKRAMTNSEIINSIPGFDRMTNLEREGELCQKLADAREVEADCCADAEIAGYYGQDGRAAVTAFLDLVATLRTERDEQAALAGRLREALNIAIDDLWAGYWSTRGFIDARVPGWTNGDDGPSYPCIRNMNRLKAALNLTPSVALAERLARERSGTLSDFLRRQSEFSGATFGPGRRTKGLIDHITKELQEIATDPADESEWIDVILLALDGFWRHGGAPENLLGMMEAKLAKNIGRKWPKPVSEDVAVEHDRAGGPA